MNILITGSSGLIGTALQRSLASEGHTIYRMGRDTDSGGTFYWQPMEGIIQFDESKQIDVVINLAGSNISDGRWSLKKKKIIFDSRIQSTQLLSRTLANLKRPPKVFISSSAIGFYGETGTDPVDETSEVGKDFLADVANQWEQATQAAMNVGIRTVNIRTGIVLSPDGGALKKMLFPFKMGLGGVIGSGNQYMSWVSVTEVTQIISHILKTDSLQGPVNMVSPEPATNYSFTKSLGKALHRPTLFPMPAFMARFLFGEMADALLLTSIRVYPAKLIKSGYVFINANLNETFKTLLLK